MNDIIFPYYSGNIYKSKVLGHISLDAFIRRHKDPTGETQKIVFQINRARIEGNKKLKNNLKTKLHTFTPSVLLEKGKKRQYKNIVKFTGLMQLDFDKIESLEEAIELKNHIFNENKEIVCAYISPSRRGVKCLMRIEAPEVTDALHSLDDAIRDYKAIYKAVEAHFEQYSYFDSATKNAILPLFLSFDTKILYRSLDECLVWDKKDWSKIDYQHLNEEPKTNYQFSNNDYHFQKVERIITKRINEIVDNGHPQVRSAALILGSRVAAGYIGRMDAEVLISRLIRQNEYLSKGTKGYIKTALWGIGEGSKTPKYF